MIPEGISARSRTSRFNVARPPTTETRPSRGPWLAIGLCCPDGSSLTTASCGPSQSLPAAYGFAAELFAPKENGLRWESRGSPIYSAGLCSRAASHTPATRRVRLTVSSSSVLAFTPVSRVRHHIGSFELRVHSFPSPQGIVTARELASPPFEDIYIRASPTRSPSISVEYDYVDKQSIPTAGLSPASPTALWAADTDFPDTDFPTFSPIERPGIRVSLQKNRH